MKSQQSYEDTLVSAKNIRTLTIKSAKERLNTTLRAHRESDLRENAWRLYDDAIRAAWDAHSAMMRRAESMFRQTTQAGAKQSSYGVTERNSMVVVKLPATASIF
jgi:hypothetical protein